jgi:hypothetical protein
MACEYGAMEMSYDGQDDGQRHKFQPVMLEVYKAKNGVCNLVAETMELTSVLFPPLANPLSFPLVVTGP